MKEKQVRFLSQEDPVEQEMAPIPVFLPGKSHRQRSLVVLQSMGLQKSWTQLSDETTTKMLFTNCMSCPVLSHSVMSDSATLWTTAHRAPLSMGILQARIPEWVILCKCLNFSELTFPNMPHSWYCLLPDNPVLVNEMWEKPAGKNLGKFFLPDKREICEENPLFSTPPLLPNFKQGCMTV